MPDVDFDLGERSYYDHVVDSDAPVPALLLAVARFFAGFPLWGRVELVDLPGGGERR